MADMVKVREDLAVMVERGRAALMSAYVTADPDDVLTYAADLIADLAHYVDSVCGEGSGAHALSMGSYHYECELVGEGVL